MTEIRCPRCGGRGKVTLSAALEETLEAITAEPGATARRIAEILGINRTTASERVRLLAQHSRRGKTS